MNVDEKLNSLKDKILQLGEENKIIKGELKYSYDYNLIKYKIFVDSKLNIYQRMELRKETINIIQNIIDDLNLPGYILYVSFGYDKEYYY